MYEELLEDFIAQVDSLPGIFLRHVAPVGVAYNIAVSPGFWVLEGDNEA